MEWLLKIVDGPMKGAEIALVSGFRAKVGSSDACDIVLADSSLAEQAFELDVSDDAVTLIGADGEAKSVAPLAIFRFGASAFAVGPATGAWGELKEAGGDATPDKDGSSSGGAAETALPPGESAAPENRDASGDATSSSLPDGAPAEASGKPASRGGRWSRRLFVLCCMLVVLFTAGFLVWFFWPRISSACPALESARRVTCEKAVAWTSGACGWIHGVFVTPPPPPPPPPLTLAEIAAQHGLTLGARNGRPLLTGNVRLRTERQAIRALALASDPMADFDLTDDESLQASATELLFVVTEGDLYATAASNRVVTLAGYAPDAGRFEAAVRALNADVPGIARLVTTGVRIGGERPRRVEAAVPSDACPAKKAESVSKGGTLPLSQARAYAIAGILTKPYPCLVMRNGMRLVEGAQIDGAIVEKIEVDRLTLKEGAVRFEWKP